MSETKRTGGSAARGRANPPVDAEMLVAASVPKGYYLVWLPTGSRGQRAAGPAFTEFSSREAAEVALNAVLATDRARGGTGLSAQDFLVVQR